MSPRATTRGRTGAIPDRKAFELTPDILVGDFDIPSIDLRTTFAVGNKPILFLPVRLETRFFGSELRVRIYPDQVHLNAHQEQLTGNEIRLGQNYWQQRLRGDVDGARDALVQRIRPRRAVWVARKTRPVETRDGKLEFPRLRPRRSGKPAVAGLLPERWAIAGFVDNERRFVSFGKDITPSLPFTPDIHGGSNAASIDEDPMAWMIDYDQALDVGMAITIPMAGFDYGSSGLSLLAVGIGNQARPRDALAKQLNAHRYTAGLTILPQGTPTNNTDSSIAGWTAEVDDVAELFAPELDEEGIADPERSGAAQLISALGLSDDSVLRRVANATLDEDAAMAAMNRALWPVTWGRYMDDLLAPEDGPSLVSVTQRNAIQNFFVDFVRGGAALPALGIGSQPYGVLPVMRRDGGDFHSSDPLVALEAIALDLRQRWRESLPGVARLDPVDGGTSDDAAAEILGSLPHASRFIVRRLTWQWALRTGIWSGLWDSVTQADSPFVGLGVFKLATFDSLDSIEEVLEWLQDLHSDPKTVGIEKKDVKDARTILDSFIFMCEKHLERQTPLHQWYPDAFSGVLDESVTTDPKIVFSGYGNATEDELFNHPLVGSDHATATHYLTKLRERIPGAVPKQTVDRSIDLEPWSPSVLRRTSNTRSFQSTKRIGSVVVVPDTIKPSLPKAFLDSPPLLYQLLDSIVESTKPGDAGAFGAALDTLAQRNEDELALRLRETLGLASYRLDAWISAFASSALAAFRKSKGRSLLIGGFGWVEGLRPDAAGQRESEGFIHAPSIAHATTAAVLRAGYHAHGSDDPQSLFAVDLRSERVRTAAWLLDGIRQGQALGDLLGCRFERNLHDADLDHVIDDCRRRVLEARGITRQPRAPVDGLELAELYQAEGIRIEPPDGDAFVVRPSERETQLDRRRLQDALDDVSGNIDAVADTSIADSVHHMLQGNTTRASATLDAVSTGAVPPPELRGLDTQIGGTSISHRVLLTLKADHDTPPAGWGESVRAALEPALAHWAATLLGDPSKIRCAVRVAPTGTAIEVSLRDLAEEQNLSALDAVLERVSTWQARVAAYVLNQDEFASYELDLEIDIAPPLTDDEHTFADAAMLATAMRRLLGSARPLDARDLAAPGADIESRAEVNKALERLERFRSDLHAATAALQTMLPEPTEKVPRPVGDADLGALRVALMEVSSFGVGAPPTRGYGESGRAALYADAWTAREQARARLSAYSLIEGDVPLTQRVDALLGKGFPLLPPISVETNDVDVFEHSDQLLEHGEAPAMAWLRDMARVRVNLQQLETTLTISELLHDAVLVPPVVGQLPWVKGEPWVAIAPPLDRRQPKLSLFTLDYGGIDELRAGRKAVGLVADTWADSLPSDEIVTGIAVNHDAPTSRAPQAMLLALPPAGRAWEFDHVVDTLLDTLEAAKLRAIDPDVLLAYGHQAPAIFSPVNIRSGLQEPNDG